jgi:lambda family phage minor tail protein L
MNTYELDTDAPIYLFKLTGNDVDLDTLYFCGSEGIKYQGISYQAIPCEITGYSASTDGVIQPQFTVFSKIISPLIRQYNHLLKWELAVLRIKRSQLTINNPLVTKPFDIFTIVQKTNEVPGKLATFKLKPRTNLKGKVGRELNNNCTWVYRSDGCGYQGSRMYTSSNQITNNKNLDICALTLTACRLRGNLANFSGIPTINDYS